MLIASLAACDAAPPQPAGPDCDLPQDDPHPVQLAATREGIFARFSDGSVYCWGPSQAACRASDWARPQPEAQCLKTLSVDFTAAGVGPDDTFTVWYVNLSLPGSWPDPYTASLPVPHRHIRDIQIVGVGLWVLDDEGVVWAIGDARYGLNLKDATYFKTWTPLEFPEPVVGIPGAGCGLLEGGRLYCTSGLWLVDYDMDVDFPLQPKEVEWDEPVVSWATSSIGCVLGASGRLLCRGDNYYSALGWKYPELGQRTTYDVIPGLPPVKSFKLADTATNACALGFDGRLFCWGDNGVGLKIVDDPALKDQAIYPATEVSQELGEIVDYAITDDSLCVLRKDDPEIYCRGFSGTGNCGIQRGWRKVSYEPCDSSAL